MPILQVIALCLPLTFMSAWPGQSLAQQNLIPLEPMEDTEKPESPPAESEKVEPEKAPADEAPTTAKEPAPDDDKKTSEDAPERPAAGGGLIINLEEDDAGETSDPVVTPESDESDKSSEQPVVEPPAAAADETPKQPVEEEKATAAPVQQPSAEPKAGESEAKPAPPVVQPDSQPMPPPVNGDDLQRQSGRGMPVWVWAVVAVVAIAIVGGLAFWLGGRRGSSDTDEQPKRKKPKKSRTPSRAPRSTPGRRPATLRDLSNVTGTPEHEILADTVQIGRATAQSDDIQSVVVKMNTVGRRHAVIEYRHHTYWLVDQGSLNGTFLNGERIHRERALNNGARIQLESAEFEFVIPDAPQLGATVAVDPGEFIETLVANEDQAKAMQAAAKAMEDRLHAAETVVDARPPEVADPAADESGDKPGSGTVDFDVFGNDPDPKSGQ